jgi:hypothetical protein
MHAYLVEPEARWRWRDLIFAKGDKVKRLGRVVRRAAHPVRVSPHALDNRERGRSHVRYRGQLGRDMLRFLSLTRSGG